MDNRFEQYRVKFFVTGDSITEGDGNASAYRYQFFRRLYASGLAFEFLGPNTSGDLRLPKAYYSHGGYCGYVIGDESCAPRSLRGKLLEEGYRRAAAAADIILLWIGFNDYGRKIDLDHITDRYTRLIEEYYKANPDVILYAGTLFNANGERPLNAWLLDPATKRDLEARFPGLRFRAVDINRKGYRLSRADCDFPEDDGHPAEAGNAKLGATWHDAVIEEAKELSETKNALTDAPKPVRVSSLYGDVRPVTLRQYESCSFRAAVLPENAEVTSVLWESSAGHVATVDDYGRVRAVSPGETTITASSLDGGYKLTARVTVRSGYAALCPDYRTVFVSDFTDAAKWDGPEDVLSKDFNKLGLRYNRTKVGEMTSRTVFPISSDACVSFVFRTANDRTHGFGRWTEVQAAGLGLRFNADAGVIRLCENGGVRGEVSVTAPVAKNDTYAFVRSANAASVYRNGEFLFAASVSPVTEAEGCVRILWHEMTKSDVRDIVVKIK